MPISKRLTQNLRDFERFIDNVCPCPCICDCVAHMASELTGRKSENFKIDRCGHCQAGECGETDVRQ